MKPVLLAVSVAVLAIIVATVWVGARVREDTVVANPYEEGLRLNRAPGAAAPVGAGHAEHHAGAAELALALTPGGALVLSPRPLRTMQALSVVVSWPAPADAVTVSFAMAGMDMGENAVRLAPDGEGRWRGHAVLVRCPSGRRDWIATVRVQGAAPAERQAPFQVEE